MSLALRKLPSPLSALLMAGALILGCGGCEYQDGVPLRASPTSTDPTPPPSFIALSTPDPEAAAVQERMEIIRKDLQAAAPDGVSGASGSPAMSISTNELPSGKYIVASKCLDASEAELVVVGTGGAVLLETTFICGEPVVHPLEAAGVLEISAKVTDAIPAQEAAATVGFLLARATGATPSP